MQTLNVQKHVSDIKNVAHTEQPLAGIDLETFVVESWRRCLSDYSIDPEKNPEIHILSSSNLRQRTEEIDQVMDVAGTEMEHLYQSINGSGYSIILTSREGVILRSVCDPGMERDYQLAGLRIGGHWGEQSAGTNGIGTCIVERRPVTVHLDEHFVARHTNLTCSAAPIFNPNGELIAILDSSSVSIPNHRSSQALVRGLVTNSARIIENQLLLGACRDNTLLRFHTRAEYLGLPHEALLCLDDDAVITAANCSAASLLNQQSVSDLIGRPLTDYISEHDIGSLLDHHLKGGYIAPFCLRGNLRQLYATQYDLPKRKLAQTLKPTLGEPLDLWSVAGKDRKMQHNVRQAARVMNKNVYLLMHGETGTGKEVFAKAIHEASSRASKPFVAINCASIPESLIESELFGYSRGAFTGARREGMKGKFVQANGGTLFLDEIGDMPLALQTRLLRCLESCEIMPLGCEKPVPVDLHVISATHRDLETMVQHDEFREDLYYRLNGLRLDMVPLREREDRTDLILEVLAMENEEQQEIRFEQDALAVMLAYDWPGNLRQLRNVIRTALAMHEGPTITLSDLPYEVVEATSSNNNTLTANIPNLDSVQMPACQPATRCSEASQENPLHMAERITLLQALESNDWNISCTAKMLNMSRNTLYRKLKRHQIQAPNID
jgi:sigma-54 dependent transcriptional regulator, acetoin dehydrogenase operon transcriptional activator AcoR